MNKEHFYEHRLLNIVQTALLLVGMGAVLTVLGYLLAGWAGALWITSLVIAVILLSPRISAHFILRLYGAQPLPRDDFFHLHETAQKLSARAKLSHTPRIYYIPTHVVTKYTVGKRSDAVIVVSIGLMELITRRETGAVVAHEIAHIRNNDLRLMSIADFISRTTGLMSVFGLALLMLMLPVLLFSGRIGTTLVAVLAVTFAPYLNILLQLALSRVREYRADITAAYLMGETASFVSALGKIESVEQNWVEQLVFPGKAVPLPSFLRTHPPTSERIRRLQRLRLPSDITPLYLDEKPGHAVSLSPFVSHQRDFLQGLWF